jgi:trimethylamine--corrinoid protein Co-methyltransferase
MVVICDEMAHMVKTVLRGFAITDETLALDVIREVGHGGGFLEHGHTMEHFRQEMFFPSLFQRQTMEGWRKAGGRWIHEVAHKRVLEIAEGQGPVDLIAGADEALARALSEATGQQGGDRQILSMESEEER